VAVLRHDVKEIVDERRLRTMRPHRARVRGPHVDRDRFDAGTARGTQLGEERREGLLGASARDPQHALTRGIDDDRRVAMPTMQRELIDRQDAQPIPLGVDWA
jgi:hypothetical protein